MKRKEFLAQLERLLWDIPVQEREEALEFYNNYFDDAGEENESSVIQELGSPGKVAAIIKADLGESRKEYGEYTETGYSDGIFDDRDMPERAGADKKEKSTGSGEQTQRDGSAYEGRRSYGSRNGFSGQSSTEGSSSQDGTGQYSTEAAVRGMTALTAEAVTVQGNPIGTEAESCGASLLYSYCSLFR